MRTEQPRYPEWQPFPHLNLSFIRVTSGVEDGKLVSGANPVLVVQLDRLCSPPTLKFIISAAHAGSPEIKQPGPMLTVILDDRPVQESIGIKVVILTECG
jgi:hypothetical protein